MRLCGLWRLWIHTDVDCVDHNKLWKILKKMGIPEQLTCLLRNWYAGQEETVRVRHGTTHWYENWERSTISLYIVTLIISLLCRVHNAKYQA